MQDRKQAAVVRAARFKEAEQLIRGSRQTLERTRQLLLESDRLLKSNPLVFVPKRRMFG